MERYISLDVLVIIMLLLVHKVKIKTAACCFLKLSLAGQLFHELLNYKPSPFLFLFTFCRCN
jgi:hypothetical protein